jgi:hypothetical protein
MKDQTIVTALNEASLIIGNYFQPEALSPGKTQSD